MYRSGQTLQAQLTSLACLFLVWKTLIALVILASPGPGYDTSTSILQDIAEEPYPAWLSQVPRQIPRLTPYRLRYVRWDAIYFVSLIQRGYLYEQEWAFGTGFVRTASFLTSGTFRPPSKLHNGKLIKQFFQPSFGLDSFSKA